MEGEAFSGAWHRKLLRTGAEICARLSAHRERGGRYAAGLVKNWSSSDCRMIPGPGGYKGYKYKSILLEKGDENGGAFIQIYS